MNEHKNIYKQYISSAPVGFCHHRSHRGAVTKQLLKKHQCLAKNCPFFEKNAEGNPEFWNARSLKNERKKEARRERMAKIVEPPKKIQYVRLKGQKWYQKRASLKFIKIFEINQKEDIITAEFTDGKTHYLYDLNKFDRMDYSKEIKEYQKNMKEV